MTGGMGRNGREIKRQYEAMETGPKGGKRRVAGSGGGQTGSDSHIWRVKLAVINPAEWALSVFSCVCTHGECGPLRGSKSVLLQGRQEEEPIAHLS